MFTLVVYRSRTLHQLDVKNAFVNGVISQSIYMEPPPGYNDPNFLTMFVDLRRKSMTSNKCLTLGSKGLVIFLYVFDFLGAVSIYFFSSTIVVLPCYISLFMSMISSLLATIPHLFLHLYRGLTLNLPSEILAD